jgi:hypothetical protein
MTQSDFSIQLNIPKLPLSNTHQYILQDLSFSLDDLKTLIGYHYEKQEREKKVKHDRVGKAIIQDRNNQHRH